MVYVNTYFYSNMCEFHISINQAHKPNIALDSFSLPYFHMCYQIWFYTFVFERYQSLVEKYSVRCAQITEDGIDKYIFLHS